MKIISVEINIEHEPLEPQGMEVGDRSDFADSLREEMCFSLATEIPDDEPSAPHVEQLLAELGRRFKTLNARKTN